MQDWYLKYQLTSVEGVAEVASIGGFVKQYQVTVDPTKLRAYNLSLPTSAWRSRRVLAKSAAARLRWRRKNSSSAFVATSIQSMT